MNATAKIKSFGQLFDEHVTDHVARYVVTGSFILIGLGIMNWLDIRDMKHDIQNAVPRLIYDVNISNLNQRTEMNKEQIDRLQRLWDENYSTNRTRGGGFIPYKSLMSN